MEQIKTIAPIFILKTRSFWLGILPLILTLSDSVFAEAGTGGPFTNLLAAVLGKDPEAVRGWLLLVSPVWGLIIAQQRSGLTRPYTANPQTEKAVELVEDGKAAFEAGKVIGQALKQAGGK